jgi:hypothetical protein
MNNIIMVKIIEIIPDEVPISGNNNTSLPYASKQFKGHFHQRGGGHSGHARELLRVVLREAEARKRARKFQIRNASWGIYIASA